MSRLVRSSLTLRENSVGDDVVNWLRSNGVHDETLKVDDEPTRTGVDVSTRLSTFGSFVSDSLMRFGDGEDGHRRGLPSSAALSHPF